jgi:hypothetical protein
MRRWFRILGVPVLAVLAVGAAGAAGSGTRVVANLTADQVRGPAPVGAVAAASGSFSDVVDVTAARAVWKLSYSGTTGQVQEARVQYIDRSGAIPVLSNHELCHPCAKQTAGVDHFPQPAFATSFLAAIRRKEAYVILFTAKNAKAGEIAGRLKSVGTAAVPPTPTTSTPTLKASATYAAGKVTVTLACGAKGTATVIISNRGKAPYNSKPIPVHGGSQTVVFSYPFTRGLHSGIVTVVFANATRTVAITITVP